MDEVEAIYFTSSVRHCFLFIHLSVSDLKAIAEEWGMEGMEGGGIHQSSDFQPLLIYVTHSIAIKQSPEFCCYLPTRLIDQTQHFFLQKQSKDIIIINFDF